MKWKTKNGDVIDIKDMTDSHLVNVIAFVQRDIDASPGYQSYMGNSDYAEDAVEQENRYNLERLDYLQRVLENLKEEQSQRVINQS